MRYAFVILLDVAELQCMSILLLSVDECAVIWFSFFYGSLLISAFFFLLYD